MNNGPITLEPYRGLAREARRIASRIEAIASGYETADMAAIGSEAEVHRDLVSRVDALRAGIANARAERRRQGHG